MNGKIKPDEIEELCPECGHAFKTFVDRLLGKDADPNAHPISPCPACGCGQRDLDR